MLEKHLLAVFVQCANQETPHSSASANNVLYMSAASFIKTCQLSFPYCICMYTYYLPSSVVCYKNDLKSHFVEQISAAGLHLTIWRFTDSLSSLRVCFIFSKKIAHRVLHFNKKSEQVLDLKLLRISE